VLEPTVPALAYRDVAERQRSLDRVGDKPAECRHRKRDISQ